MDERHSTYRRGPSSGWVTDDYAAMLLGFMLFLCLALIWLAGSPA